MSKRGLSDTLLVSISMSDPDNGVLIVGRKRKDKTVDVVNAFQGEKAREIYNMLTRKENKVREIYNMLTRKENNDA